MAPNSIFLFVVLATACSSGGGGSNGAADGSAGTSEAADGSAGTSEAGPALDAMNPAGDAGATGAVDAGLPPLDPNADINSLTNAQSGELCDWSANVLGGYGYSTTCAQSVVQNPADQAHCISQDLTFNCPTPVTVGEFEMCILAQVPSQGCDFPTPQCNALLCKQ